MNSQGKLLARTIFRNVLSKRNASYGKRRHPIATFNDLPVPEGDFFALHAARERRNNLVLGLGIVTFVSTLYVWKSSGLVNMNSSPPDTYE